MQCHGWRLAGHPLLLDQLDRLITAAERARISDAAGWQGNANVKLLATLRDLMLDRVPRDPLATEFRQGNTLGPAHRHWFRAKFGANRFRLFLRADSASRIIVYAWVNDRDTLRKASAASDPYAVFARMLAHGNPPDTWPGLLAAAQDPATLQRFAAVAPKP
ncbi:type II toxin-antitoxin system YhaV family toxin [Acidisphaera sp. S103]|uniref:type II toxin-antitoxin system YhaV family toxin n=1 Tax=Acidisphaera sp. S103 TaxID=1747223 RepID=UPI00131B2F64|nr:type II toxin-antitoxin system YhaV family toxin [Acidisphaera sp. S103]